MKKISLLFLFINSSLVISQTYFNNVKVNTDVTTKQYKDSRKFFYGELIPEEYKNLLLKLETELNTKFTDDKAILINFEQAAYNCGYLNYSKNFLKKFHDNSVSISKNICQNKNAVDFFIYDANSFLKKYAEKNKNFKQDSGFFATKIFTLKESCQAFFLLKPNGKFLICYGTDSLSYASNYLDE